MSDIAFMPDWMEELEGRSMMSAGATAAPLTVMTQNLYIGADLDPVVASIASGDRKQIMTAISNAWASAVKNDFPSRAAAIAKEIDAKRPALIGLQEADSFFTGPADSLHGGSQPAKDVRYDFVQSLLDALRARGLHYGVAATS